MITCKEDLYYTYIENDFGELRDAYVKACKEYGIDRFSRTTLDSEILEVYPADGDLFTICGSGCPEMQSIPMTLSDLEFTSREEYDKGMREAMKKIALSCGKKFAVDVGYEDLPDLVDSLVNPKSKTRTEYREINGDIWELEKDFKDGNLYRSSISGGLNKLVTLAELCDCVALSHPVYYKVEKTIDWHDEALDFLANSKLMSEDDTLRIAATKPAVERGRGYDKEFLEWCRVILRAAGELPGG